MGEFVFAFAAGKPVDNNVLGGANFSTDTTHHEITCPSGKRWLVLFGAFNRDVASTIAIDLYDSADLKLQSLCYVAAAAGAGNFPMAASTSAYAQLPMIIMEAGDYVGFVFGVAQTAAAYCRMRVLEIDA